MKFSLKKWRQFYEQTKELQQQLIDSYPDEWGNPAVRPLTAKQREEKQKKIDKLQKDCRIYLDLCGYRKKAPLYHYDINDDRTHASSSRFAFKHLVKSA